MESSVNKVLGLFLRVIFARLRVNFTRISFCVQALSVNLTAGSMCSSCFSNVSDLARKSVDASIRMATELLMLIGLLEFIILFCSAVLMTPYGI